jgi:hypothetical protein
MAARQRKIRSPTKPRLTKKRFKQIVRELEHLSNKYEGDLDKVIPSVNRLIKEAKELVQRFTEVPRAGAPELWIQGQLVRLLRLVRAIQIAKPNLDDRGACRLLAWEGFWVFAHDPRSIGVEDVRELITNPETLRRRLAEAKKSLLGYDEVIREIEQEAHDLANGERLKSLLCRQSAPTKAALWGVSGI